MRRAQHMAKGRKLWTDILNLLSEPAQRAAMVAAALRDEQPLTAVIGGLLAQFGAAALSDRGTKLFTGAAIAGVMESAGFDVSGTGDRLPVSVASPFRTAARYVGRATPPAAATTSGGPDDLLVTMIGALDADQRQRLRAML
jgi:hypothetical protein